MDQRTSFSKIHSIFHSAREYLSPILKESKFKATGLLTPDEFVAAGDFLVTKCPTWQWSSGQENQQKDYLPADKQYLITKNVPCLNRVKDMEDKMNAEDGNQVDEDGFMVTMDTAPQRVADIDEDDEIRPTNKNIENQDIPDLDEIPDLDDEDMEGFGKIEDTDDAVMETDKILKTRF
jgi:ubiquitin-like-conjugating enzyme ATG3